MEASLRLGSDTYPSYSPIDTTKKKVQQIDNKMFNASKQQYVIIAAIIAFVVVGAATGGVGYAIGAGVGLLGLVGIGIGAGLVAAGITAGIGRCILGKQGTLLNKGTTQEERTPIGCSADVGSNKAAIDNDPITVIFPYTDITQEKEGASAYLDTEGNLTTMGSDAIADMLSKLMKIRINNKEIVFATDLSVEERQTAIAAELGLTTRDTAFNKILLAMIPSNCGIVANHGLRQKFGEVSYNRPIPIEVEPTEKLEITINVENGDTTIQVSGIIPFLKSMQDNGAPFSVKVVCATAFRAGNETPSCSGYIKADE
ncbi:MAG: hypothetical protein HY860_00020 [Chlamydiales bacterium]|nr:hypothetical protein [Chlamydiales bacterium]